MFTFHNKYKDAFPLPVRGEGWLDFDGNRIRYHISYDQVYKNAVVATIHGNISDSTNISVYKYVRRTHNMWKIKISHFMNGSDSNEDILNSNTTVTYVVKNLNKLPDPVRLIMKHICAAIYKVNQHYCKIIDEVQIRHEEYMNNAFNQLLKRIDNSADQILLGSEGGNDETSS